MEELRLAIAGKLRSGKTTLVEYAVNKYGMVPFAFADELKKDFHRDYPQIPKDPKPREGYQLYGTLKRYVYGADYWIKRCEDQIDHIRRSAHSYNKTGSEIAFMPVITDLRLENELVYCRKNKFIVIKVECPEEVRIKRALDEGDNFTPESLKHKSETFIDEIEPEYIINNTGSKEDMFEQFDEIIEWLKLANMITYNIR